VIPVVIFGAGQVSERANVRMRLAADDAAWFLKVVTENTQGFSTPACCRFKRMVAMCTVYASWGESFFCFNLTESIRDIAETQKNEKAP
jgi:hypothetical protein